MRDFFIKLNTKKLTQVYSMLSAQDAAAIKAQKIVNAK